MNHHEQDLKSISRTRRVVDVMLYLIVAGAVFYSLMTSTPLVSAHSVWHWSGWALGLLTDAAFVLSIAADSALSRHGVASGRWASSFRWVTGAASLFLNTWSSVSIGDWVGVAVHSISPVVLVFAAEVAPIYRRLFRQIEVNLSEQVKEFTVTRTVSRKVQVQSTSDPSEVAKKSEPGLTDNQRAIRDGFLANRKAAEVAREIGVSGSYVAAQYRKIKSELTTAA